MLQVCNYDSRPLTSPAPFVIIISMVVRQSDSENAGRCEISPRCFSSYACNDILTSSISMESCRQSQSLKTCYADYLYNRKNNEVALFGRPYRKNSALMGWRRKICVCLAELCPRSFTMSDIKQLQSSYLLIKTHLKLNATDFTRNRSYSRETAMKAFGAVGTTIAILDLTPKIAGYIRDAKDASKECHQFAIGATELSSLLTKIHFRRVDDADDKPWFAAIKKLEAQDGPLHQYYQALKELHATVAPVDGAPELTRRLMWKWRVKNITKLLVRLERLKSLVNIALGDDHL